MHMFRLLTCYFIIGTVVLSQKPAYRIQKQTIITNKNSRKKQIVDELTTSSLMTNKDKSVLISSSPNTPLFAKKNETSKCIVLENLAPSLSHLEPRCLEQDECHNVSINGTIRVGLYRVETKPGKRLVGTDVEDAFPCYPLSNKDILRSRHAVKGDTHLIRKFIQRAKKNLPLKIVSIGGSVTNGGPCGSYALKSSEHGRFGPCSWTNRFVLWMKNNYNNHHINLISLAKPGTTTSWILSRLDALLKHKPDLLLVDYSINDAIIRSSVLAGGHTEELMRGVTEILIRKILKYNENNLQNPCALLYVVMQRSFEIGSYHFANNVYYPVCREYDIPVLSVRDAIWPTPLTNNSLQGKVWETSHGAHPVWKGHQVVTDLLSFTFTQIENEEDNSRYFHVNSKHSNRSPSIDDKPFLFRSSEANDMDICSSSSSSHHHHHFQSNKTSNPNDNLNSVDSSGIIEEEKEEEEEEERESELELTPMNWQTLKEWSWSDYHGKKGWQFTWPEERLPFLDTKQILNDFKRENLYVNKTLELPDILLKLTLPEIITFQKQFNYSHPGMLIDYMKSYEGFGDVICWMTLQKEDNENLFHGNKYARQALLFAWVNVVNRINCLNLFRAKGIGHRYTLKCEYIITDTWSDPSILSGHWSDHSSQIVGSGRSSGLELVFVKEVHAKAEAWDVTLSSQSFFLDQNSASRDVTTTGGLTKGGGSNSDVVTGYVHFMAVPWSFNKVVSKFKIMDLITC